MLEYNQSKSSTLSSPDKSTSTTDLAILAVFGKDIVHRENRFTVERLRAKKKPFVGKPDDIKDYFDEEFYLETYPEVAESGMDPLIHYWNEGWSKGFDPAPEFSTTFYVSKYPDVAKSEFNPFWHYVRIGKAEGRLACQPEGTSKVSADRLNQSAPAEAIGPAARKAQRSKSPGKPEDVRDHFDKEFYLETYPEVAERGLDPLIHYWNEGWRKGFDPTPEFSTTFYVSKYPDVAKSEFNPFWHYVRIGKAEGRLAHVSKDISKASVGGLNKPAPTEAAGPAERKAERSKRPGKPEDIKGHFDEAFYLKTYPEIAESGMDPLAHYWNEGWSKGFDPTPEFSTTFYVHKYPDVAKSEFNPFWHYVRIGKSEGRLAYPPKDRSKVSVIDSPPRVEVKLASGNMEDLKGHFDEAFYLETYPEVAESGMDPLTHYWSIGWAEGRDPNSDFSTAYYLKTNKDVIQNNIQPFWHYVVAGQSEGRLGKLPPRPATIAPSGNMEAIRPYFDSAFYLGRYRDVAEAGIDPLTHYWTIGWSEGRDPAPDFSTQFYLEGNADVAAGKVNPFWHYVVAGKAEGRLGRHPGGPRVARLRVTEPFENRVKAWRKAQPIGILLDADTVLSRIADAVAGTRRLIVSIGHDRYWKHSGGVQLCIHREERLAAEESSSYLYVYPVQALPRLAHVEEDNDVPIGIVVNGTELGECRISALIAAVAAVRERVADTKVVIHHMLGHLPERLAELIHATGRDECFFWLHDFFAVCPSYTLQRNDVAYCAGPPLASNACTLCSYGGERQRHLARMRAFFDAIHVHLLSPSEVALKVFEKISTVTPAAATVVAHMTLRYESEVAPPPESEELKPTIGFLGTPAAHKGWEVFDELMRRNREHGRYRFVFCGASGVPSSGIEHVLVHVTAEHRSAMVEAVAREKIDLVLHWASWPETFSLSTYEALAGGAFVVTNPLSGNVAAAVRATGRGVVLENEEDLYAFFEDGRGAALIATARADRREKRAEHTLSRMTYEMLEPVATRGEAPL